MCEQNAMRGRVKPPGKYETAVHKNMNHGSCTTPQLLGSRLCEVDNMGVFQERVEDMVVLNMFMVEWRCFEIDQRQNKDFDIDKLVDVAFQLCHI